LAFKIAIPDIFANRDIAGLVPLRLQSAYVAAKAGVAGFVRAP